MSAGQRFKFQGSTIAVITAFEAVGDTITAITKANPAVVTATAHGLADGDVVRITGVVGMTEVNNGLFVVDNAATNTFELFGVDSTGYGTYTSGGTAAEATFSNWCELTGYNRQGGSKTENNASSLCSTAQEFELGLPDFGTTQFDFFFAPQTAIQLAIKALDASGARTAVKVVLPNSGGSMVQMGYVQQMSEQSAVNGMWTASVTMRNTGARYDWATA
jgi:hypothetical protein